MAIKIDEPVKITREDIVGIDFGTTNSLIGIFKGGKVEIISDDSDGGIVPSVVAYEDGKVLVGAEAKEYENAIFSVKRLLGRNLQSFKKRYPFLNISDKDNISIDVNGEDVNVVKIASDIFLKLKKKAENCLGKNVKRAVVTVPAYFDNSSRNAVKNAAKIAGLDVVRLLSEPTAAALSYGVDKNKESGTYVVYDLGGGTFDVSVLSFHRGIFKVLSTGGDDLLGGDDFDKDLADYIVGKFNLKNDRKVISLAKNIKERLAHERVAGFSFCGCNGSVSVDEFNKLVSAHIDRTIEIVKDTLKSAEKSVNEIDGVLLVGGSTRVALISDKLAQVFGRDKILADLDPDTIVAKGAALYASFISGANPDRKLLLDILPLSLGIETLGGAVERIILKDSRIPISQSQMFTNYVDGQTSFKINVIQGEREFAKDNRSLAEFTLNNIPPLPAGKAKIEVKFTVNEDGLLVVSAKEITHDIEQKITVNPAYGLTQNKVDEMIEESFKNARDDVEARQLLDAKSYAEKVLKIITNAIKLHSNLLDSNELKNIDLHLDRVKHSIESEDCERINKSADDLERSARDFLQRRLEFLLQGMEV